MNTKQTNPLLDLLIKYKEGLISRDFILDYIGDAELMTKEEAIAASVIKPGKLFVDKGDTYVVTVADSPKEITRATKLNLHNKHKLSFYDRFKLKDGMIENHSGGDIETTVGVFILNYNVLVKPFGSIIPYVNGVWNIGKIESRIAELVIEHKITPQQVLRYIDYVYALSGLNDICVPALSEGAITANPKVSARRDELLAQHKDDLHEPNVMMAIEDELIAMDKALLKGDVSNGFMIKSKNYDVQRKRMFLMIGVVESFGDAVPSLQFSTTNLNDGWDLNEMDILANDVRRGSYNRAKTTALGGAESKMLGRNFQDSAIVEDDCGTTRGLSINLTEANRDFFVNRNIIHGNGILELTDANIGEYIGKPILVRSPMYCQSRDGYCYTCMDSRFKKIDIKLLNIHPLAIGSTMLTAALKSMHGTKLSLLNIDDINSIVI